MECNNFPLDACQCVTYPSAEPTKSVVFFLLFHFKDVTGKVDDAQNSMGSLWGSFKLKIFTWPLEYPHANKEPSSLNDVVKHSP